MGLLTLVGGPSGASKSSYFSGFEWEKKFDELSRVYRVTTRDIREGRATNLEDAIAERNERIGIDGILYSLEEANKIRKETGKFESKFGGTFVSKLKFFFMRFYDNLVGVHRYPDPKSGHWYGYPLITMLMR